MNEEISVQQGERASQDLTPLVAYVDEEIARLEESLRPISSTGHHKAQNFDDYDRLAQFRQYKQQMTQPQPRYTGIAAELQSQQTQYEYEFQSLQQQLIPRSPDLKIQAMPGDNTYFSLQEHILREQRILAKTSALLDQDDKAYIDWKINEYRGMQANTRRGSVLHSMNNTQLRLQKIRSLRQLIPQSAAPLSK